MEDGAGSGIQDFNVAASSSQEKNKDSFKEFLKLPTSLSNMIIFVYLFCAVSFNYYLLNFYLKYMPGDIYENSIVSSVSESVAHYLAGWIVIKIGTVQTLGGANVLAVLSGLVLWVSSTNDWVSLVPYSVLAAKFGTGGAFAVLYMSTL